MAFPTRNSFSSLKIGPSKLWNGLSNFGNGLSDLEWPFQPWECAVSFLVKPHLWRRCPKPIHQSIHPWEWPFQTGMVFPASGVALPNLGTAFPTRNVLSVSWLSHICGGSVLNPSIGHSTLQNSLPCVGHDLLMLGIGQEFWIQPLPKFLTFLLSETARGWH